MDIKPGKQTRLMSKKIDDILDMAVTDLPGIGTVNGEKLKKKGYRTVLISVILLLILYV